MKEELVKGKVGTNTEAELTKLVEDIRNKVMFGVSITKLIMLGTVGVLGLLIVIFMGLFVSSMISSIVFDSYDTIGGHYFGVAIVVVLIIFIIGLYAHNVLRCNFNKGVLRSINNDLGGVIRPAWVNKENFYSKVVGVIDIYGDVRPNELKELAFIIDVASVIHNTLVKDEVLLESLDNIEWNVDTDKLMVRLYNTYGESYSHVVEFPKNVEIK